MNYPLEQDVKSQKIWLFFAGPENWLDEAGERDFSGELLWSCETQTRPGDLGLLYRKSIDHLTPDDLVKIFNMKRELAEDLKARGAGKDISAVWKVISVKRWFLPIGWKWPAGCWVQQIVRISPPMKLSELRANSSLWRNWRELRSNFHAPGRAALEIPASSWKILSALIQERQGVKAINKSPHQPSNLMETAREKHPRAYEKWDPKEERQMINLFKKGATPGEIAKRLGRQSSAIRSRLKKIGILESKE